MPSRRLEVRWQRPLFLARVVNPAPSVALTQDQQTDFRPCNPRNFHRLSAAPGRSLLKSAANSPVGLARSDVAGQFRPGGMHGVPGMVPRKRRLRFGAFVIERHLVLNFFERFARIFQGCFDTCAIRRRVVVVTKILIRGGLLRVLFPANKLLPSLVLPLSLLSFLCYCFTK